MIIDDNIVQQYLSGMPADSYNDCWIYNAVGRGYMFETPSFSHRKWVLELYDKLKKQITEFIPRNYEFVRQLFPDFNDVAKEYTIMLVVGFPDPYDAMVLNHNNREYLVFDLIQFGQDSLSENYSCHKVLTHELIHICLHKKYPVMEDMTYIDNLAYIAFDEGFAHALSYPEDIRHHQIDNFQNEKYKHAKNKLLHAVAETDIIKQREYRISSDTGAYWDKFASISGKMYLLENIDNIVEIYNAGWEGFTEKILGSVSAIELYKN